MHGCSSTTSLVVNAEVDSMGGVVEGGVGIANRTSPRQSAVEKVQIELRQEYDVREKRKRELEFLEKGGNPLDFKLGVGASASVQSTSFTDQHPDHLFTSEAKGSVAFTASPHGDSVESSGRPAPSCEPNSADNLMLFDAEHEFSEGERKLSHPSSKIAQSEQLSQVDGNRKSVGHGDSAAFGLPGKAYKRRNRSRPNRDGTKSNLTDVNSYHSNHGSILPSRHSPKDVKGLVTEAENQNISSNCRSKPTSPIQGNVHKVLAQDGEQDMDLDGVKAVEQTKGIIEGASVETVSDAIISDSPVDKHPNQQSPLYVAENPIKGDSNRPESDQAKNKTTSAINECEASGLALKVEIQSNTCHINGFNHIKGDMNMMSDDANHDSALLGLKGLDSVSSCTETGASKNGDNDGEMYTKRRNADSNGDIKNQAVVPDGEIVLKGDEHVKENKETLGLDSSILDNEEIASVCPTQPANGITLLPEGELNRSESCLKKDVNDLDTCIDERMEICGPTGSSGRKHTEPSSGNPGLQDENSCNVKHQNSIDASISDLPEAARVSTVSLDVQRTYATESKLPSEIDEDSILKEAQIIEAKRKRIAELSMATSPQEIRRKSHWDYVLEEIAWLANDFSQECIWKIAAAAQICHRVAFTCRLRKHEKTCGLEAKKLARTLAKSVMDFWHSAEEESKELEQRNEKDDMVSVRAYAARFLKFNKSNIHNHAEMPSTPDRTSDSGVLNLSWEDSLTEENLFYNIPAGAMETYRESIEAYVAQREKIGYSAQEEVETSACDAAGGYESQDIVYDEDEGETNTYDISVAFEASKSSRSSQKKRKHLTHAYTARSYEIGSDLFPMQCTENKVVSQQSLLLAKRPGSSLNASIPTKRMRTASRRIISPFSGGISLSIPVPNKADASSGDTNSFQDDQSTLCGGSLVPNSLEVESAGEFEKQFPYDPAEVSTKPKKKKKKPKHLNVAHEQRWQVDSSFQSEQFLRDQYRKKPESHQLESNGSSGLMGQPVIKKPKILRQSQENSFDNIIPMGGSVPSPAASQMSNMSNPNKFIKMLGARDRGRKPKALKAGFFQMPARQQGSGSPWSLFEDQALVVLAHDLGPNWELVSDAINSTLHFKCIFRKAKECKGRHNFLMDRTSGDGADSAEDSESPQPYPSTLPGIPKGSARQLFQRLQGPMEEDTLKSHFEKIIMIGRKQHYRKNQDPKQLQQPHSSHTIALSQVCPNNLDGGPILTPLDLCDASVTGPDMLSIGFQGPHSGGLTISNQSTVGSMQPATGAGSTLQGSPSMILGNNFSSSPGPLNSSIRYAVPRSAPLLAEEQQRMQQYNHMISGRNIPQPNLSSPGALPGTGRGIRVLPGGNGMSMACSVNRSMPMARPGVQGIASSSMVNSVGMIAPGIASANVHSGVGSGQGSSMLRSRDALNMMRPGLSPDAQRQMVAPDIQMPGSSQGVSHFGGLSSPYPSQTVSPAVQSFPPHHHQPSHPMSPQQPQVLSPHHPHLQGTGNHTPNSQHQACAMRIAKERQLQNRLLQQQPQAHQQQQFGASNSLMMHAPSQPQAQLPISSPMQTTSQVQPQASSTPVSISQLTSASMNPMPHQSQKHPISSQGIARNAQAGLANQTGKQRQRQQQQFSQANRHHPQQRQQSQSQPQQKVAKGVGRGNLIQNIPTYPSLMNGVSTNTGTLYPEKGEPPSQLIQSQGLYSGSALHTVQPQKQCGAPQSSNQSLPQQKMYSGPASSSKHPQQMTTHSDNSSQGHAPAVAPGSSAAQSLPSLAVAGSSRPKIVNQNQLPLQRVGQLNRQLTSDPSNKPQVIDSDIDQHQASTSTNVDAVTTLPQMCNGASNVVQISPAIRQWHASELLDSNALNSPTNLSTLAAVPSNSSESVPQSSQGLGQRHSSASLSLIRLDSNSQCQQQPSQALPSPIQQPQQPQSQQSLQQAQLLQAGNGNMHGRTSDPRLD